MSAISFCTESALDFRGQFIKAGVRKAAKTTLSRATRRAANRQITQEVKALSEEQLQDLSADELELYADQLLAAQALKDGLSDLDAQSSEEDGFFDYTSEPPLHLQGSLPDWMLHELEAAKGDAFALLSLFEAKSPSPKAAFLTDDDEQFA